jgi:chemotaxis protein MotB
MAKKTIVKYEGSPIGGWMITFSDMNTLLLTFFVLLFSMSSLSESKIEEAFDSDSGDSLGLLSEDSWQYSSDFYFDPIPVIKKSVNSAALSIFNEDDAQTPGDGIPNGVEFDISDAPNGTISIMLADNLLFAPGQTNLTEESKRFLDKVRIFLGRIVSISPRTIIIEGHTDNTSPVDEGYILSSRRAEKVLQYLLEGHDLPPALFSVVGYGASKPIVVNNSEINRARNRRVRIIVETSSELDAEAFK